MAPLTLVITKEKDPYNLTIEMPVKITHHDILRAMEEVKPELSEIGTEIISVINGLPGVAVSGAAKFSIDVFLGRAFPLTEIIRNIINAIGYIFSCSKEEITLEYAESRSQDATALLQNTPEGIKQLIEILNEPTVWEEDKEDEKEAEEQESEV